MAATPLPENRGVLPNGSSPLYTMSLNEVLDDLLVRFILNLPADELTSMERIYFQCEQAHWFYEDFVRPLNPGLNGLKLRNFSFQLLQASKDVLPLIQQYLSVNRGDLSTSFNSFMKYKHRVPVCGAILLNKAWDKALLVKGWNSNTWTFPKGKINQNEAELACAVREVHEETGYNCGPILDKIAHEEEKNYLEIQLKGGHVVRLYIAPGVEDEFPFATLTRKEISKIGWVPLGQLYSSKNGSAAREEKADGPKFYNVAPFVAPLRKWITANQAVHPMRPAESETVAVDLFQDPANMDKADSGLKAHPQPQGFALGADADRLKSLLGLEAASPSPAPTPQTPANLRAAELIAKHGDARSHEFLSLMREDQQSRQARTRNAPDPTPAWTTEQAEEAKRQAQGPAMLAQLFGPGHAATPPPTTVPAQPQPRAGNNANVGYPVAPDAAPGPMVTQNSCALPQTELGLPSSSLAPQARSLLGILGAPVTPPALPSPATAPAYVTAPEYTHAPPAVSAPSSQSQALLNLISPNPVPALPPSMASSFSYPNQAQQHHLPLPAQLQATPGAQQQHALLGLLGPQAAGSPASTTRFVPSQPLGIPPGVIHGSEAPSWAGASSTSPLPRTAGQEASLLGLLNGARP